MSSSKIYFVQDAISSCTSPAELSADLMRRFMLGTHSERENMAAELIAALCQQPDIVQQLWSNRPQGS